jgi:very-short-patch-repair endonuclease
MNENDRLVAAYAERQLGLVTRRQLLGLKVAQSSIARRVRGGGLVTVHPGVYRVAGAPGDRRSDLLAATLWSGDQGALSRASACEVLRLDVPVVDEISITVPQQRPLRSSSLSVHRASHWSRLDRVTVDGIACTTATRALIDMAWQLDGESLDAAFQSARRMGLSAVHYLERQFERLGGRGRAGSDALRRLIERERGSNRALESKLEIKAAKLLRRSRLSQPRRQHWVTVANGARYRLDFAWPEHMVAVECDSFEWHGNRLQWKQDDRRASAIEALGWRIVFVTWDGVVKRPDETLHRVAFALGQIAA